MTEEKGNHTLSDKIFSNFWIHTPKDTKIVKNVILAQDVKEFIKKLKEIWVSEFIDYDKKEFHRGLYDEEIDKIFGDKLR